MTASEGRGSVFDRAAADFARLGVHLWYPIGRALVDETAPAPGERVLDACCGNGASALPAADLVGPGGVVDAIDLSAELLADLAPCGSTRPQLRTHLADATAWEPDGYDAVQCALGIFFFPDMEAGTRHLISRARPGGRIGLAIWRGRSMEAAGRLLALAIAEATDREHEERPEHLIDRIGQAGAFAAWLGSLGLDHVRVVESPLTVSMSPEIAWLIVTGSGFVGALRGLTDAQVEDVRQVYLRLLAEQGIAELDATTLIGTGTRPAHAL